ncbi:hypothetical protein A2U01_0080882 [Trifolium medium]|uniref:Uncharacterized protein n=1 Tax=Trifolium medium TaxID=97028 RepID=A0A392TGS9_9FABA|nr:hypothetical protein [Trifolium medium]
MRPVQPALRHTQQAAMKQENAHMICAPRLASCAPRAPQHAPGFFLTSCDRDFKAYSTDTKLNCNNTP